MDQLAILVKALRLIIGVSLLVVAMSNMVAVGGYLVGAGLWGAFSSITIEHGASDDSDADRWVVGEDGIKRPKSDGDALLMLFGNRYGLFVVFLILLLQLQPAMAFALIGSGSVNRYKAYFCLLVAVSTAAGELVGVAFRSQHATDMSDVIASFMWTNIFGLVVALLLGLLAVYYFRLLGSVPAARAIGRLEENADNDRPAMVRYAGFWTRFGALSLDFALVEIAIFVAMLTLLLVGYWERETWNHAVAAYGDSVLWATMLLYYTIMESSGLCATVGKLVYGIGVVDEDGQRLLLWRAALRNLFKILSAMILFVGFLLAAVTKKNQALHDLMTRSFIVKTSLWRSSPA